MTLGGASALEWNEPTAANRLADSFNFQRILSKSDPLGEHWTDTIKVRTERAFPDYGNAPASSVQRCNTLHIPASVPSKLFLPESWPGFRQTKEHAPGMVVPETSVDEHRNFPSRQNQIRPSGKPSNMQPVTQPSMPKAFAHVQFREGVFAPDS
jgi:hypothetical protein